jgi:bifunctional DNA-binding transcriptional regulator/antitoxin component of YhaV-PrlF toxin-antitoxin module
MKVTVRKVGNSLGVLIPKSIAESWGISERDTLEIDDDGVHSPSTPGPVGQQRLDILKRQIAAEVLARFSVEIIRARSLENLARWKRSGVWNEAYDAWFAILSSGDETTLYKSMLGTDDESNRLRQSMPFVGLLPKEQLRRLREEAAG